MPFDLATISTAVSTTKTVIDTIKDVAPGLGDVARAAAEAAFASIRVSQVSTGHRHLYPRLLRGIAWEMVAVADLSLLNLADEPADIESITPYMEGPGKVALWTRGLVLNPIPPGARLDEPTYPTEDALVVGCPGITLSVRGYSETEGFPLVIAAGGERRIRLAFLLDRRVERTEEVTFKLRCRQRGQRLDRPMKGKLTFTVAEPSYGPARIEYHPLTGYLTWVSLHANGSMSGSL